MKSCNLVLTFENVDTILWCGHSNESSSQVLLHGIICFSIFCRIKFVIFLEFLYFERQGISHLLATFPSQVPTPSFMIQAFTFLYILKNMTIFFSVFTPFHYLWKSSFLLSPVFQGSQVPDFHPTLLPPAPFCCNDDLLCFLSYVCCSLPIPFFQVLIHLSRPTLLTFLFFC